MSFAAGAVLSAPSLRQARRSASWTRPSAALSATATPNCCAWRARLAREQAPISAGTLTHEVYLALQHRSDLRFGSRAEFLGYAGRAMRSLLVDMARERLAAKRHAELMSLTLGHDLADKGGGTPEQLLALNQALERLGELDSRLLQVAEMRAVLGLEVPEIAAALNVSEPTVKRDWRRAASAVPSRESVRGQEPTVCELPCCRRAWRAPWPS